jgi:hypothetical protein
MFSSQANGPAMWSLIQGSVCYLHRRGPEEVGCCCMVHRWLLEVDRIPFTGGSWSMLTKNWDTATIWNPSIVILLVTCIPLVMKPSIKSPGESVVVEASNTRVAIYSFLASVPIYVVLHWYRDIHSRCGIIHWLRWNFLCFMIGNMIVLCPLCCKCLNIVHSFRTRPEKCMNIGTSCWAMPEKCLRSKQS